MHKLSTKWGVGRWISSLAVVAATVVAQGGVIYQNDFSERRSAGDIPDGRWHRQDYYEGLIAEEDYEKPFGEIGNVLYTQDGWMKNN